MAKNTLVTEIEPVVTGNSAARLSLSRASLCEKEFSS